MSRLSFSILTPSYNQAAFIEETLLSVRHQNHQNLEHIVVDGGSTDGTVDALNRHADTYDLRWVSEPDDGQSDAINKGLAMATGDVIGWVNSDDTYLRGAVAAAEEVLLAEPDVQWLYGDGHWIDLDGFLLRPKISGPYSLERLITKGMFITQPAMFMRRTFLEAVGGLDRDIHTAMDYDLCLRLASRSAGRYLPMPLATRRVHPGAKTATMTLQFHEDSVQALDRFLSHPDTPPSARRVGRRARSLRSLTSAYRAYNGGQFTVFRRLYRRSLAEGPPVRDPRLAYGAVLYPASMLGIGWLAPSSVRKVIGRSGGPGPDVTRWWESPPQ